MARATFLLVALLAGAAALEAPFCATTCAGTVTLAAISPPQCTQPTQCAYRCATSYYVLQTQSTLNVLSLLPPTADCNCASGTGQVTQAATIPLAFSDGTSAIASVSGGNLITQGSAGCTSTYKITSGSVLNMSGPPTTAVGSIALETLTPAECVQPSSCNYQCARFYTAVQAGNNILVTSLTPYISECYCATGTGTVQAGKANIDFSDGGSATASVSDSILIIESSTSGVDCQGFYGVVAGSALGVRATSELVWGTITMLSVSPSACNVSASCDYLCGLQYTIVQVGLTAEVLPTSALAPGCTCQQGEGHVSPDGSQADVTFPSGTTAHAAASGKTITITATVEGLACTGIYAVSTGSVLNVAGRQ